MKRVRCWAVLALVCATGCASLSNTERGVGVGALTGAGVGAALGSVTGNAGAGAAIGAAAGGLFGGVVGNDIDKQEKRELQHDLAVAQATAATPVQPPLSLTDIAQLSQQQVDDAIIINQIRTTGSVYNPTAQELAWLKQCGVSSAVIMEVQNTAGRSAPRYVQPTVVRPVVYAEPVYYAPRPVGFRFGYTRCH